MFVQPTCPFLYVIQLLIASFLLSLPPFYFFFFSFILVSPSNSCIFGVNFSNYCNQKGFSVDNFRQASPPTSMKVSLMCF